MKNLICTILFIFTALGFSWAQISEGTRSMSLGSNNSLSLDIPNADEKTAKKVWSKFMKQYDGKTKSSRKTGETFTDNAEITALGGSNTVDVYAKFADAGENCNITVWFDLGGAYLSSDMHPDKYSEGEKMLIRFAIEVAIEATKKELDQEEKRQKELERKQSKLVKNNEDLHRDIENYKEKIKKAEAEIEQNVKDQKNTKAAIEEQKEVVGQVKKKLEDLEE